MPVTGGQEVPVLTNQQQRVQDNADGSISPYIVGSDRNDQRVAPVAQAVVALSAPPAALTAAADTSLTWTTASGEAFSVRRVYVQNKSAVNVYVAFDAAASLGSVVVYPQWGASFDVPCNVLHVYCASALNVNGTADGNLVVLGWL